MKVKLHPERRRRKREGISYPIRPRSFVASIGVHGAVLALLVLVPSARVAPRRPIYTELIEPQAEKIVWRNLREPLPHVSAPEKVGLSEQPRGVKLSSRVVVATSPQARSETQFIWQPVPKIEIRQDLPLPNLVSRVNLPAPPPPLPAEAKSPPPEAQPKPPRPAKAFVPPSRTPSPAPPPAQVALPDAPAPSVAIAPPSATVLSAAKSLVPLPPRPVKTFVPPSPTSRPAPAPSPVALPDAPAPSVAVSNVPNTAVLNAANSVVPLPPRPAKAFVPPSRTSGAAPASSPVALPDAPAPSVAVSALAATAVTGAAKGVTLAPPPAPPPSPGNGTADLAIASIRPAERAGPVPDGARPGQFSAAPAVGPAATGDVSGITVPNLTLRDSSVAGASVTRPDPAVSRPDQTRTLREEPRKVAAGGLAPRTILYSERLRNIPVSTLSAPLRPASRTIPRDIDARFQGRYVYAMVMPIENLPMYGGDWILWFAERNQRPGDTPSMRAPILYRKVELIQTVDLPAQPQQRFQLAGTITKEGRIEGISMLTKAGSVIEQTLIRDLASWEFKPATRDGTPVDVEVVIEIPFNFSQLAERTQP
jgi:hypothetical protein